jgi:nucleotide-binding universal stress UspA family protein
MSDRIFVAVDDSECSLRALDAAADLAKATGGTLIICTVVDTARAAALCFGEAQLVVGAFDALRDESEALVDSARERARRLLPDEGRIETRVVQGGTVEEVLREAKETAANWIVMGSHSRTGVSRLVAGSIAEEVLRQAHVPVMIVPVERKERAHAPA